MKNFGLFLLLTGLLGLCACATVGNEFPSDYAAKLVVGKTTRADVEKQLGAPNRSGLDSGDPTATYMYYRLGLFVDTITKDLTIRFDGHGVVKSYTYNANIPPAAEKADYNAR
jgi:outer membrane protein assembly factor BamE (lipoprotein component of BamABCDE complex)